MKKEKSRLMDYGEFSLLEAVEPVDEKLIKKYDPDFTKLHIEFVPNIQGDWAADWDATENIIKIHKDLNTVDRHGVIIHEFIEMMVTSLMGIPGFPHPDYDQDEHGERNQMAHNLANEVEKRVLELAGINWKDHEKRVDKVRGKTSKK